MDQAVGDFPKLVRILGGEALSLGNKVHCLDLAQCHMAGMDLPEVRNAQHPAGWRIQVEGHMVPVEGNAQGTLQEADTAGGVLA